VAWTAGSSCIVVAAVALPLCDLLNSHYTYVQTRAHVAGRPRTATDDHVRMRCNRDRLRSHCPQLRTFARVNVLRTNRTSWCCVIFAAVQRSSTQYHARARTATSMSIYLGLMSYLTTADNCSGFRLRTSTGGHVPSVSAASDTAHPASMSIGQDTVTLSTCRVDLLQLGKSFLGVAVPGSLAASAAVRQLSHAGIIGSSVEDCTTMDVHPQQANNRGAIPPFSRLPPFSATIPRKQFLNIVYAILCNLCVFSVNFGSC